MSFKKPEWLCTVTLAAAILLTPVSASAAGLAELSDEELLAFMVSINEELAGAGMNIAIEQIEFFTIGQGRPPARIHQQPFRWVPNDPRRAAQGADITYMIDDGNNAGATSLGFFPSTEVRNAMTTWDAESCMSKVDLIERPTIPGLDVTIFDGEIGAFCPGADLPGNGLANFVAADIIHAGWYPANCFAPTTLAFSVTFTFTGTDLNGDNYLDTALNEVYYNDAFNWGINVPLGSGFDVETVALHESGHSLELGHFGPPPDAVMNPIYAGIRHSPLAIDHAGMCAVWSSWPNP